MTSPFSYCKGSEYFSYRQKFKIKIRSEHHCWSLIKWLIVQKRTFYNIFVIPFLWSSIITIIYTNEYTNRGYIQKDSILNIHLIMLANIYMWYINKQYKLIIIPKTYSTKIITRFFTLKKSLISILLLPSNATTIRLRKIQCDAIIITPFTTPT